MLLLNRFAHRDYVQLTRAEAQRDGSDRGQLSLLAAEATRPDAAVKEHWLNEIFTEQSTYKLAQQREVMAVLFPANQLTLLDAYGDRILAGLPQLTQHAEERLVSLVGRYLLPATCSEQSVARLQKALREHSHLSPSLTKSLMTAHQEDQLCLDMKKLTL